MMSNITMTTAPAPPPPLVCSRTRLLTKSEKILFSHYRSALKEIHVSQTAKTQYSTGVIYWKRRTHHHQATLASHEHNINKYTPSKTTP